MCIILDFLRTCNLEKFNQNRWKPSTFIWSSASEVQELAVSNSIVEQKTFFKHRQHHNKGVKYICNQQAFLDMAELHTWLDLYPRIVDTSKKVIELQQKTKPGLGFPRPSHLSLFLPCFLAWRQNLYSFTLIKYQDQIQNSSTWGKTPWFGKSEM